MAYGRIAPFSRFPAAPGGLAYPKFYNTAGGNGAWRMLGLGIAGGLASDSWWELFFSAPVSIPTGQLKLELWSRANASTGVLRPNPYWVSVSMGQNPGAVTCVAQG